MTKSYIWQNLLDDFLQMCEQIKHLNIFLCYIKCNRGNQKVNLVMKLKYTNKSKDKKQRWKKYLQNKFTDSYKNYKRQKIQDLVNAIKKT